MTGAKMTGLTVTEYTDPLCPWAWGSESTFQRLRHLLGPATRWRQVFGILFDDGDDAAPDEAAETRWYHEHLREISAQTRAPCPTRLERVARTSWPASLVVTAAAAQGEPIATRVLRRLREQTFLLGTPPDTMDRAIAAAAGVPGLDLARLTVDAASASTRAAVEADHAETRRPIAGSDNLKEIDGGHRYVFPTLLFAGPGGRSIVPGWHPLGDYLDAARRVAPDGTPPPSHVPINKTYPDGN